MAEIVKCVAIDDEPLALEVIDKFCQRLGGIELNKFSNPVEGLEFIKEHKPDISFLDIEMSGMNGLQIASFLPKETCFIFTTAYLHYALDGFDLDAVDFLHKPFAYSRFQAAFNKALRRLGREQLKTTGQSIVVKQEYNNINIPTDDILYIEAMEGYSKIFRTTGSCVVTRMILKNLSAMLPADNFIRIHRSFIISKSKVKSFTKQEVILFNGTSLPVGRQYSNEIMQLLMK